MTRPITLIDATKSQIAQAKAICKVISTLTQKEVTKDTVSEVAGKFKDAFYNKYNNKDMVYCNDFHPEDADKLVEDSDIYVDIAENQPDYAFVEIGDAHFDYSTNFNVSDNSAFKKISIGKNAYLCINVWKVVDGVLKVAVPYLYTLADAASGICKVVTSGGFTYEVEVADPNPKALKIASAEVTEKEGYESTCTVEGTKIVANIGHFTQALGIVLNDGESDITDTNTVIYRIDTFKNLGLTVPEAMGGKNYTYVRYMFGWADKDVTETEENTIDCSLVVPGRGTINFSIEAHAIPKINK